MAEGRADGRIVIDTRVRTENAEKDLKALRTTAEGTARQLAAIDQKAAALRGNTRLAENLAAAKKAAKQTADEMDRVTARLDAVYNANRDKVQLLYPGLSQSALRAEAEKRTKKEAPDLLRDNEALLKQYIRQEDAIQKADGALRAQAAEVAALEAQHGLLAARLEQETAALHEAEVLAAAAPQVQLEPWRRLTAAVQGAGQKIGEALPGPLRRFGAAAGAFAERAVRGFGRLGAAAKSAAAKAVKGLGQALAALNPFAGALKSCEKTAQRFGSRFRRIASGALLFNGLSSVLRLMVEHFRHALLASSNFRAALGRLKGAASMAASPLRQILIPAMTALANAAATALAYLAKLIAFLTGKTVKGMNGTADAIAGVGTAAKKARPSLAGFDEITRLNAPTGGGGSGGDDDDIQMDFTFDKSAFWQSLVDAIQAGDWAGAGGLLADKINGLAAAVDWKALGRKLGDGIDHALTFLASAIKKVDWWALGEDLATALNDLIDRVDWKNLGTVVGAKFRIAIEGLGGVFATLDWEELGRSFAHYLQGLWESIDWGKAAQLVSDGVTGVFDALRAAIAEIDWQAVGQDIAAFIRGIEWGDILSALWELVQGVLDALWGLLDGLLEGLLGDVWRTIKDWLGLNEDEVKHSLERAGDDLAQGADRIKKTADAAGRGVADTAKGRAKDTVDTLRDAWGTGAKDAEAGGGAVRKGFEKGLAGAVKDTERHTGDMRLRFAAGTEDMELKSGQSAAGIRRALADGLKGAADDGARETGRLTRTLAADWSAAEGKTRTSYSGIQSSVRSAMTGAAAVVGQKTAATKGSIHSAWSAAQQKTATSYSAIQNSVRGGMSGANATVGTYSGSIQRQFGVCMSAVRLDAMKSSENIKQTARSMMGGVQSAIQSGSGGIRASLVSAFTSAINGVIGCVNRFIGWLNSALTFSWNGLTIGKKQIFPGGSVKLADLPGIPYLAQGAVIPPNREFLAVLGDQSRGTNIEAPLATIQQAVAEVMADSLGASVAQNEAVVGVLQQILQAVLGIHLGDDVVAGAVARYNGRKAVMFGQA